VRPFPRYRTNGLIKDRIGFRRFPFRWPGKARRKRILVMSRCNLKRMFTLTGARRLAKSPS
jgi:hypothetical protein